MILVLEGKTYIYRRGGNIVVKAGEKTGEFPPHELEAVIIIGYRGVITTSALHTMVKHGTPVVFVAGKTNTVAVTQEPITIGDTTIREAQYACIRRENCKTYYATKIIESKIKGLYYTVKYEAKHRDTGDLQRLKLVVAEALDTLKTSPDLETIRSIEAHTAKHLWGHVSNLIPRHYKFQGRRPRAKDPINQAISYTYAILYGLSTKALSSTGLDPFAGFLHSSRPGKTSLTYDFAEIYKPLAIHAVIQTSRRIQLKLREDGLLTPKSVKHLTQNLYKKLQRLSVKTYKRQSIWTHPMREAYKLKKSLTANTTYNPYTYNPNI